MHSWSNKRLNYKKKIKWHSLQSYFIICIPKRVRQRKPKWTNHWTNATCHEWSWTKCYKSIIYKEYLIYLSFKCGLTFPLPFYMVATKGKIRWGFCHVICPCIFDFSLIFFWHLLNWHHGIGEALAFYFCLLVLVTPPPNTVCNENNTWGREQFCLGLPQKQRITCPHPQAWYVFTSPCQLYTKWRVKRHI